MNIPPPSYEEATRPYVFDEAVKPYNYNNYNKRQDIYIKIEKNLRKWNKIDKINEQIQEIVDELNQYGYDDEICKKLKFQRFCFEELLKTEEKNQLEKIYQQEKKQKEQKEEIKRQDDAILRNILIKKFNEDIKSKYDYMGYYIMDKYMNIYINENINHIDNIYTPAGMEHDMLYEYNEKLEEKKVFADYMISTLKKKDYYNHEKYVKLYKQALYDRISKLNTMDAKYKQVVHIDVVRTIDEEYLTSVKDEKNRIISEINEKLNRYGRYINFDVKKLFLKESDIMDLYRNIDNSRYVNLFYKDHKCSNIFEYKCSIM